MCLVRHCQAELTSHRHRYLDSSRPELGLHVTYHHASASKRHTTAQECRSESPSSRHLGLEYVYSHLFYARHTLRYLQVVDRVIEIVDEFQGKILNLEHEVLLRPKMKTVRKREFTTSAIHALLAEHCSLSAYHFR